MSQEKIRIGIFGGSGYGGSELLRILLFHPHAEVVFVTANEQAGKPVSEVHKNLLGLTDLEFSNVPQDLNSLGEIDCAFLALPHGPTFRPVGRVQLFIRKSGHGFPQPVGRGRNLSNAGPSLFIRLWAVVCERAYRVA